MFKKVFVMLLNSREVVLLYSLIDWFLMGEGWSMGMSYLFGLLLRLFHDFVWFGVFLLLSWFPKLFSLKWNEDNKGTIDDALMLAYKSNWSWWFLKFKFGHWACVIVESFGLFVLCVMYPSNCNIGLDLVRWNKIIKLFILVNFITLIF